MTIIHHTKPTFILIVLIYLLTLLIFVSCSLLGHETITDVLGFSLVDVESLDISTRWETWFNAPKPQRTTVNNTVAIAEIWSVLENCNVKRNEGSPSAGSGGPNLIFHLTNGEQISLLFYDPDQLCCQNNWYLYKNPEQLWSEVDSIVEFYSFSIID